MSARLCLAILPVFLPVSVQAAAPRSEKAKPPVLTCKTAAADGLGFSVIKPGKGAKPGANAKVRVNYKGWLKSNGTQFDAGEGAEFRVGGVIPGFAQGLQLMQAGGKYRLCIPAALGYGAEGAGEAIPPNADLVFEVELLSFTTPPPKPTIPAEARGCMLTTASGLSYTIATAGAGRSPTAADLVLIDVTTFDPQTGAIMARELWEKIPMARTAPPFSEALALMQPGASYRFCFPASETSEGEKMPAIGIIVDMIAIRPAPESND